MATCSSSDRKKQLKERIEIVRRAHQSALVRGLNLGQPEDMLKRQEARRKMENLRDLREIEKLTGGYQ